MGTIVILFVYLLTVLALPIFMWRRHRRSFSVLRHVVIPSLGALSLIIPFVKLCEPGQPSPYSVFPFLGLAIVAVAVVIAFLTVRRYPSTGLKEGAPFGSTDSVPRPSG